ncbi:MAG: winged helix DNA-binding domain-containing protein [Candidatus Dormibacteraeota bacterium]|nr:winged helix DNA-binding domain-containing protein [Candidatus Dormibacteraeota bacterium]
MARVRPAAKPAIPVARALLARSRSQRLAAGGPAASKPAEVLDLVAGLQAQLLPAAGLGLRARLPGIRAVDIERALAEERSIVRSWLMRGTLHLVAAPDLRWMLRLLGPGFARGDAGRQAQLGLDEATRRAGVAALRRILAGSGPLTRTELLAALRRRRIWFDPKSQAVIHLIRLAALQGVLCLGPSRPDGEATYVLLDDWLPAEPPIERDTALAELARRYFRAYGPANVADLAAWSGLSISEARAGTAGARADLCEVTVAGEPALMPTARLPLPARERGPNVRLLPAFDTYLLGYRRRDLAVSAVLQRRLQRGGGWIHPAVLVDGRAVAAWQLGHAGSEKQVLLDTAEPLARAVRTALRAEVADLGRFLERPVAAARGLI